MHILKMMTWNRQIYLSVGRERENLYLFGLLGYNVKIFLLFSEFRARKTWEYIFEWELEWNTMCLYLINYN